MRNFFRVAAVILATAAGVYLYELTGGEIAPVKQTVQAVTPVKAVAVSRSPIPRIKTSRTIDRSRPMPSRPAGLERMIEAKGGSDFPVMIPQKFTQDDAASKRYNVRLRLTDDGYTSVLTLPDYDVVIYGTRSAFRKQDVLRAEAEASLDQQRKATGQTDQPALTPVRRDYAMNFEEADDGRGGSLSFGRYGVDYHIEFYCHDETEGCINAGSAGAFLADMFAEKKKKPGPQIRIDIGIGSSTREAEPDTEPEPEETRP